MSTLRAIAQQSETFSPLSINIYYNSRRHKDEKSQKTKNNNKKNPDNWMNDKNKIYIRCY